MSRRAQHIPGGEDVLAVLTPSQREAVQHMEGPQQILAGPGSGKTRVVTHRIAHMLLRGVHEDSILALTFTNKAANEMQKRLDTLCPSRSVWIGTFHRFCAQQLRRHAQLVGLKENYSILDTEASLKLLREAIHDAGVQLVHETPGRVATAISAAKNNLIIPDEYQPALNDPLGALAHRIYPYYQRRLLAANAVDFDDLLMHMALLLRDNAELRQTLDERFCYIMVDEYQDTNLAQYAIVRALSIDHPNLSVTGDPDQSIYGWRGATIRNILEFDRDFPRVQVVRLENNFRSTQAILRAADQLIVNNLSRKEKRLHTSNPEGKPVRIVVYPTAKLEADAIAARVANEVSAGQRRCQDYAIFYRTNALSRTLERSFRAMAISYQIVRGLEFYQRKEVKDVLAYLELLNNPANDAAFLRIVNVPPRQIGKVTLQRLSQYAREHRLPLFAAARRAGLIQTLSKRTATKVATFVALMDSMRLVGEEPAEYVMQKAIHLSGYREWLSGSSEGDERLDNLDELLTDAREFDESHPEDGGLEAYLEQASLVADADDWDTETDRVAMMTLHAAKGLEFPVVFIVGVEEDLLPHIRSQGAPEEIEEERRLLFVGMTRAEEELHLCTAERRAIRGKTTDRVPSPFLMELPRDEMDVVGQLGRRDHEIHLDYVPVDDWNDELGDNDDVAADERDWDSESDGQEPEPEAMKRRKASGTGADGASLAVDAPFVTAAEMMGSHAASPCPPESFRRGMAVIHPKYGVGKIVSVGGSGVRRSASVQFSDDVGKRSFQLAYSPLRPIGR